MRATTIINNLIENLQDLVDRNNKEDDIEYIEAILYAVLEYRDALEDAPVYIQKIHEELYLDSLTDTWNVVDLH